MNNENNDMSVPKCLVDQKETFLANGMFFAQLDKRMQTLIRQDYPNVQENAFICNEHLVHYQLAKIDRILSADKRLDFKRNDEMIQELHQVDYQIQDVEEQLRATLTFGQKVADGVAKFGGSWSFILIFILLLIIWILLNVTHLFGITFDPYPFILLNLFLSMLAAIQAPLIMMSQNRAAKYDRLSAQNDYHVNLKSEKGITVLHEKLDHIIQRDQPNILEIQRIQTEMLGAIQLQLKELSSANQEGTKQVHNQTSDSN